MFNYTKTTLKKLEAIFEELGYTVRYEKGNFQSGYCIVENRNVAVINKFFDTEARINTLIEILSTLEVDEAALSDKPRKMYRTVMKSIEKES